MARLLMIPAVVLATGTAGGLEVDLLPGDLADVGDIEIPCGRIEVELPGIAQAVSPDLRSRGRMVVPSLQAQSFGFPDHVGDRVRLDDPGLSKGIVGRDAVGETSL